MSLTGRPSDVSTHAAWRAALTIVSLAALATTGWSLFAVARHYQAPPVIAGAAVAVFDGAAYACLHLASEASKAGRSAAGARLATLTMTGTSIYLNVFHADLIDGGLPAALLFSVPTLALLAVSELAWAGPRAEARQARGEHPYRLPAFGGWAWFLAPFLAGRTVKARAVAHIENAGAAASEPPAGPTRHSATEVLRRRFAEMDPADAIRIAHDAHPDLTPGELASLLVGYGVIVDAIHVALVLSTPARQITVERNDAPDAPHDADDAPHVSALPAPSKTKAIIEAAASLGPRPHANDIVDLVQRTHRITVDAPYVRTVLSRARRTQQQRRSDGPMEGGYA
ncbi:hypothetical protein ACWD4V_13920 [Streptomyces tsukubensis]